ncbi:MAG: pyrroline-5-carboxylate reductase [Lachnospiraceae bacterium]|jgi:pyrroline-5-carboxylate reductase|nr:pyrroline-5-carboxylate reductase [Lachnospiraceae bacterium]
MKIGFIGLGNMATAMIEGITKDGSIKGEMLYGADVYPDAVMRAKERYHINGYTDSAQVAAEADILFLVIKPVQFAKAIDQIKDSVRPGTIVVSIGAGITLSFLKERFGRTDIKLIRCMPNTPAFVLEGMTGVSPDENVTMAEKEMVLDIFGRFGKAQEVPERLMDSVVAVSGSAPAYIFLLIEAMADGAVAAGMPRQQAYDFAAQTVYGSAKMVLESGKHPAQLKDMVCSPAGTTIAAVKVLEEKGFRAAVLSAMEACVKRSIELG